MECTCCPDKATVDDGGWGVRVFELQQPDDMVTSPPTTTSQATPLAADTQDSESGADMLGTTTIVAISLLVVILLLALVIAGTWMQRRRKKLAQAVALDGLPSLWAPGLQAEEGSAPVDPARQSQVQQALAGVDLALGGTVAEVPLDAEKSKELGISAAYVQRFFPDEARRATGTENPNFYDLCNALAIGPQGRGYGITCPRDGRPNCSFVDAVEPEWHGKATHFVSWCWKYTLEDVVDALGVWMQGSECRNRADLFLWMCWFCNNQYRIIEEGSQTGSDDLKTIFESHLDAAGHMLVILDSFMEPHYFTRAWCLFETYVCIEKQYPRNLLLPSKQLQGFQEVMETAGPTAIRTKVRTIDLRKAEASVKADEDAIKTMIYNSTGFDAVNTVVQKELLRWMLSAFERFMLDE